MAQEKNPTVHKKRKNIIVKTKLPYDIKVTSILYPLFYVLSWNQTTLGEERSSWCNIVFR